MEERSSWYGTIWWMLRETTVKGLEDGAVSRGAALAYYVLLSLGPMLALFAAALGGFLADRAVNPAVVGQIEHFLGARAAGVAETVMAEAQPPEFLSVESLVTMIVFLFGATAAFANVRGSLNAIWGVEADAGSYKEHVIGFFLTRLRAIIMMTLTGVILAVSFLVTTGSALVFRVLREQVPFAPLLIQAGDFGLSVLVVGVLFGTLFRTLPDIRVEWGSIWIGAFTTATMFVVGKTLIGRVIAGSAWTTYYGPGAAVVAFLFWVYLSAQLFFFGAEFTKVWSASREGAISE